MNLTDKPIAIASDHAGLPMKSRLIELIDGFEFEDLGTHSMDSVDYPDFADLVAKSITDDPERFGVLICGSGQGMAIRANKFKNIRAALCWSPEIASLARQHNNANILVLPGRFLEEPTAVEIFRAFFCTEFEGGRHQRRVEKLSK